MVYEKFYFVCLFRLLLLTLSLRVACYSGLKALWLFLIFLTPVIVYQICSLFHYINKTNHELSRFIEAITYSDLSQTFKDENLGQSFSALRRTLSEVIGMLRETRAEKEAQYHYLQTVVRHVSVGLVVFRSDGSVELINHAAKQLLRTPRLKNISDLRKNPDLVDALLRLPPRKKGFVRIEDGADHLHLALNAVEFKLQGENHRLVSIQNIQRELEEKELDAWQKLIRVLTHEIMNSVTPISTLASTIHDLCNRDKSDLSISSRTPDEWLTDIHLAAETIEKRSRGLLRFVNSFRGLTLAPKPKLQFFRIQELFNRVERLLSPHIKNNVPEYSHKVEPAALQIKADPDLLEQILINLLLNAVQALENQPSGRIQLAAALDHQGRVVIQVVDNGPGVAKENLENIFVPFFSTKENGSGIGLSLSRQIMRLHHGSISVHSEPNVQTIFYLMF